MHIYTYILLPSIARMKKKRRSRTKTIMGFFGFIVLFKNDDARHRHAEWSSELALRRRGAAKSVVNRAPSVSPTPASPIELIGLPACWLAPSALPLIAYQRASVDSLASPRE